jgi:hypothetical protein
MLVLEAEDKAPSKNLGVIMAKHKNCPFETAHRPHNINVGWQFSYYERCAGIMSADDIRRAEIRDARRAIKEQKKLASHERKMNRLRNQKVAA